MRFAILYEFTRVSQLKSIWILAGLGVAVACIFSAATGVLIEDSNGEVASEFSLTSAMVVALTRSPFSQLAAVLIGMLIATSEYRYSTIDMSQIFFPRRQRLLFARISSTVVIATLFAIIAMVCAFGAFSLVRGLHVESLDAMQLIRVSLGYVIYTAGMATIGMSVGVLVRSQLSAVLLTIGWINLVEPLLRQLLKGVDSEWKVMGDFLPLTSGGALIHSSGAVGSLEADLEFATPFTGGAAFLVYVFVALVPAWAVFVRRDA